MIGVNIKLISASAGSGKTYRLTEELLVLLNGHERKRYHPSQIIATTFTRAAAAELKNKVRQKILESEGYELAASIDQALISTVNSIGGQLLSMFAFEMGLSPTLQIIDEEETNALFSEAIHISLDVDILNEIDALGQRFSLGRHEIVFVIKRISDTARINDLDVKALRSSAKDSIKALQCCLPKQDKNKKNTIKTLIKEIPRLRQKTIDCKDTTGVTAESLKNLNHFLYRLNQDLEIPWADWASLTSIKCGKNSSKAGVFEEIENLMSAHLTFPEFQNDLFNYINLCFEAAIASLLNYEQTKKAKGLIDFVDQEASLLKALEIPNVQARFKDQFKVLLVDEFQDTSPLQLALFIKISSLVEKVIWVGDSKQAIYGFRGSDAQLINTVIEALGKPASKDILKTSYRSTPELVQLVNDLFAPAFQKKESTLSKEEIVLVPNRNKNNKLSTSLQLWGFNWQGYRSSSNAKYNSHLALRVAQFLKENHFIEDAGTGEIRPIKPGDITIICRTNNNCREMANALRSQGLGAVVADNGIEMTGEWRLLKACLHLLVDKSDNLSKAEIYFLTSETHDIETLLEKRLDFLDHVGEDYDQINAWLKDSIIVDWIEQHREALLALPISGIIQHIYSHLFIHDLVMQWGEGIQRHANLDQILTYAKSFENYCTKSNLLPGLHGFLSWFNALVDREEDTRGLITNENSINVLTYHRSKGLEWPIVLLYGLDKQYETNAFEVRVHAKNRIDFKQPLANRSIRFWPWPYKTSFGTRHGFQKFTDCCKSSEDFPMLEQQQYMEALRLLYVGFTRARDYLIIPFRNDAKLCSLEMLINGGVEALGFNPGYNFNTIVKTNEIIKTPYRLWVTSYVDIADEVLLTERETNVYTHRQVQKYDPFFINPSGAVASADVTYKDSLTIHEAFVSGAKDGEESSDFGTFVHRVLCAFHPDMSEREALALIGRIAGDGYKKLDLQKELLRQLGTFYAWIYKEFRHYKIHKELPVMMESNGQLTVGIMDMVIETDTSVTVIDYKTFIGDKAAMQAKAKAFSGQLKLYMEILKQSFQSKKIRGGIYFIMHGMFVELLDDNA